MNFMIFLIIRYLLITPVSRSCLIKSWCTEENISCRVSIPHAVFPSSGVRASPAQRCHHCPRHQYPYFERCQVSAGLSPPSSIQLLWKPGHRGSRFQTRTSSAVSMMTALRLRAVNMSCAGQDIPPKFSTKRLSSILTLVTAVLTTLALTE